MNSVIVCEFGEGEPVAPVGLSVVDEDPEILLNLLVYSFCLAVCLRMEGGRHVHRDVEHFIEFLHELGDKLRSPIRDDGNGHAMSGIYMVSENSSPTFG